MLPVPKHSFVALYSSTCPTKIIVYTTNTLPFAMMLLSGALSVASAVTNVAESIVNIAQINHSLIPIIMINCNGVN